MPIEKDQIVSMHYELSVDGNFIESNLEASPIEFTFGNGELVPGLESRIIDMKEGETREINVPADEAYGEYNDELTETLPATDFEGLELEIGLVLEAEGENGEVFKATVIEVTDETVTVDYNHPFAGQDLEFKVVLKSIV